MGKKPKAEAKPVTEPAREETGDNGETIAHEPEGPAYVGTPTLRDALVTALAEERAAIERRVLAEDAVARRVEGSKPITIDFGDGLGTRRWKGKKRKGRAHDEPGAMFLVPFDQAEDTEKKPDYD